MRYPDHILRHLKERKAKGAKALPPLPKIPTRATWAGMFIGYNMRIEAWRKCLTISEISEIAKYNGESLLAVDVAFAYAGRKISDKKIKLFCLILRIDPKKIYKNIPKMPLFDFNIYYYLTRKPYRWKYFFGPIPNTELKWALEQMRVIASYCQSLHVKLAHKMLQMRLDKLSRKLGILIATNAVWRAKPYGKKGPYQKRKPKKISDFQAE